MKYEHTDIQSGAYKTLDGKAPIVIAHRGASGLRPEHTLESYDLAIDKGADFIEPDLVLTKDGHLVARHDRYLSTTTNVADYLEFKDRKTVKPGHEGADWFVEDFTLAEMKSLRAIQPRRDRDLSYDGQFTVPTFDEIMALAQRRSEETGRRIGVYPETKHPAAFEAVGLSFDDALLETLNRYGYGSADDPVFIQSFEADILKRLRPRTSIRFIFLTEFQPTDPFNKIAAYADGVGPYKGLLLDENGADSGFVTAAHNAGLAVHPWTFRDDALPDGFVGNGEDEILRYLAIGIDGFFTDFAGTGRNAVTKLNP